MTRNVLDLGGGDWRFGSVAPSPFGAIDDVKSVSEWLPAQVPGDVRLDLLRAQRIADPYSGEQNEGSQWVDGLDWWYTRDLELELEPDERAFIVFEGIDYQSAVWFGGQPLGRHTGMFSRQVYELKPRAQRSELAVRVWGAHALPRLRLSPAQWLFKQLARPFFKPPNDRYPDRYATLKCQMQFGWDFSPRLLTCGIWDDVCLIKTRRAFITDLWVKSQPDMERGAARMELVLTVDCDRASKVSALVVIEPDNFQGQARATEYPLRLLQGEHEYVIALDMQDVRFWNPWDRGEPNLYRAGVELVEKNASLDKAATRFGIRSLGFAPLAGAAQDAEPWSLVVNGRREFIRGANWVPMDAMPGRLTRDDYAARVAQARSAQVNFLRVWGGGLKEKKAFYDLCDEQGILVWQEFPFAGAILDRFPRDREFLALTRQECGAIVRALRSHPALAVWCGGNEFNTRGNSTIVETLRETVVREDGTRPFKPASPYRDESHNWRVWHRGANLRDYRRERSPFLSEFGLQSPPPVSSLRRFISVEGLYPPGREWLYHRAELGKLERYARAVNPKVSTLDEFVAASQAAQALGLQIAVEHMRRNKARTAGVAVWQFDDPWPAISWSVVDYYGDPKRAYAMLQQVYSPVLASYKYPLRRRGDSQQVDGEIWLINDLLHAVQARLVIRLNGREIDKRAVNAPADESVRVGRLALRLAKGENLLVLELQQKERTISINSYDLNFCDVGEIHPLVNWAASLYGRWMR